MRTQGLDTLDAPGHQRAKMIICNYSIRRRCFASAPAKTRQEDDRPALLDGARAGGVRPRGRRLHPPEANVAQSSVEQTSVAPAFLPALPQSDPNSGPTNHPEGTEPQNHSSDPVAHALLDILHRREDEQKHEARAALDEFDRKQWRQWSKSVPARATHIRP